MSKKQQINRRDVLRGLGFGAAAVAVGGLPIGAAAAGASALPSPAKTSAAPARKRLLRIGHLTDLHIQPERGAVEGVAACLRHVQGQADKPDLLLVTGDCIMDSFKRDEARTKLQWDLWQRVWRAENSLPVEVALGNHDIWGWHKARSKTTGAEPLWGKKWACDVLGLARAYRSFDRGGWHFVALDSVQPFEGDRYTAKLDDEQFAWLESDLAGTDPRTPVMIFSHIPIISIAAMLGPKSDEPDVGTRIGHAAMHQDWRRLRTLFARHANVKVAVSGHLHLIDRVDTGGVSYLCHGAVSGGWWKQPHLGEGDAGYALIDLYDDGSFEREYVRYGWTYRPDDRGAATAGA